jgi:hypothetical protein
MAASRASSRAARLAREGSRWAARTKGRAADAYEETDDGKKEAKEDGRRKTVFWWAR